MRKDENHHFEALSVAREASAACIMLARKLRNAPGDLKDQLERAAISFVLNLAEGAGFQGRQRKHFFSIAYGSAREARACLELAIAANCVDANEAEDALELVDRVCAMCWKLSH